MKRQTILTICVVASSCMFAQNPIIRDQFSADPTARVFEGKVYLYPSHDIPAPSDYPRKDWFCMADYHVFSSENLTDWTDHGVILTQNTVDWVNPTSYSMWAPDCVFHNGKYYFFFPANQKGAGNGIGVAISDKPYGPFVPEKTPIKGVFGIDPCVFFDKDGQAYMVWGGGGLCIAKLKDNLLELASKMQVIQNLPNGMKEGPFLFERNGIYYLTFPWAKEKTETLAYSTADNPMGPYKFRGIIMDVSKTGCWTNHHSIVEYKGQWYLFYHHNDYSPSFDKNRSVRVDSLFFNADGTIKEVIPTLRGVGLTEANTNIQLDRYSNLSDQGASIAFLDTLHKFNGWEITLSPNAWVRYNNVNFAKSYKSVTLRVIADESSNLEICAGGKSIAKLDIPSTSDWKEIKMPVKKVKKGIFDVMAQAKSGNIKIDWIKFE